MTPIKSPKKLIEVALPLDAINDACAYEKMPGIGAHPRGIHLWWARRPLAAARAVIFAQMVNDPGYQQGGGFKYGVNKEKAAIERERLFRIIEDLVLWKNTNNEQVIERACAEIRRSWRETCELNRSHPQADVLFNPDKLPAFHDPFAGGGALPLEAQRLGMESYASDLNPVAVTINKAMIEIPPRFAGRSPIGPLPTSEKQRQLHEDWDGAKGLAEDVRRYGAWLVSEATKQLGPIYPHIKINQNVVAERPDLAHLQGIELKPIAWLWARTVKSPNPAFAHLEVPLVSSFVLSNKEGKEIYIQPVINGESYQFKVVLGKPGKDSENGTKVGSKSANFQCLLSKAPISGAYIKSEAKAGRIGQRLMAIVAEGPKSRLYLSPTEEHEAAAKSAIPQWQPDVEFFQQALGFRVGNYGMSKWSDLFTPRQLATLETLSTLIASVVEKVKQDALAQGFPCDGRDLDSGGSGALAYAQTVAVFLAFAVDRCADFSNTVTRWVPGNQKVMNLFGKQAIAMTWDFPEAALLENTVGGFLPAANYIADCIETLPRSRISGFAMQENASKNTTSTSKVVSTDPPYYDNIGYADLSDFFYVWLRRSLREIFPNILRHGRRTKS
jgi:putative DNA methylase